MHPTRVGLVIAFSALAVAACASGRGRGGDSRADNGISMVDGAVVLGRAALAEGPGSILAAMTGAVTNFRVIRNHRDECPQVSLRTPRTDSRGRIINPQVYVDGARASDTCILEQVRSADVERIEVYPQGFTNRPGYGRHVAGLILVFLRSG